MTSKIESASKITQHIKDASFVAMTAMGCGLAVVAFSIRDRQVASKWAEVIREHWGWLGANAAP